MIETGNFGAFRSTIYNPYLDDHGGQQRRSALPSRESDYPHICSIRRRALIASLMPAPTNSSAANNYTYNACANTGYKPI